MKSESNYNDQDDKFLSRISGQEYWHRIYLDDEEYLRFHCNICSDDFRYDSRDKIECHALNHLLEYRKLRAFV
jgi:hypothetical protein